MKCELKLSTPTRLVLSALVALSTWSGAAQAGSWTRVATPPGYPGTMLLMSDGSVLVQNNNNLGDFNQWMRLTPNAKGSYFEGSWDKIAPMGTQRLYFASHVLADGRLWVLGGEYSGPNLDANWINTGEVYNPLTNAWTPIANHPEAQYGDVPSMLLDGGRVLAGSLFNRTTYLYDIATNSWSFAANKAISDASDEEGWVKLPNGTVMTYDLFASIQTGGAYAEAYNPSTRTWSSRSPSDGTAKGSIPQLSSSAMGYEMGPALTLRDRTNGGKVLFLGATGHTATYQVGTKTWTPGPDIIGTYNGKPALFGADDAPAAELPNGHVILAADAGPTAGLFNGPTQLFDYDPDSNTIAPMATPFPRQDQLNGSPAYGQRMLMLPTGRMMMNTPYGELWIYTPDGAPKNAARPLPTSLHYDGRGQFTLNGLRLTGLSAGSNYGDDAESDENFPVVSLTDDAGLVFYGRTYNWHNTGVQQNRTQTTRLTLKAGSHAGMHRMIVSAAGVRSNPLCVMLTDAQVAGTGKPADVPLLDCTPLAH